LTIREFEPEGFSRLQRFCHFGVLPGYFSRLLRILVRFRVGQRLFELGFAGCKALHLGFELPKTTLPLAVLCPRRAAPLAARRSARSPAVALPLARPSRPPLRFAAPPAKGTTLHSRRR